MIDIMHPEIPTEMSEQGFDIPDALARYQATAHLSIHARREILAAAILAVYRDPLEVMQVVHHGIGSTLTWYEPITEGIKATRLAALNQEAAVLRLQVAQLGEQVAERDARLLAGGALVAEATAEIAALREQVLERDGRLAAIGAALAPAASRGSDG